MACPVFLEIPSVAESASTARVFRRADLAEGKREADGAD